MSLALLRTPRHARRALLLTALAAAAVTAATAQPAVLYPAPEGVTPAADFRVWVDGRELFLYDAEPAAYGIFSVGGPVEVAILPTHDVKWVDVRPLSLGIRPALGADTLRFRLPGPTNLSVELNGESQRVLNLFAAPLEQNPPGSGPGVHYFEAGRVHDAGEIVVESDETVYIAGGAVVRGTIRTAPGAQNVRVMGRGVLQGGDYGDEARRMIWLDAVASALVEGITIVDSRTWTVVTEFARDVHIDNVKILNWRFGTDGIDLVSTSDVLVENAFVRANDDCVVVKSLGRGPKYFEPGQAEGPAPGSDVSDIVVRNSVFWNMAWGNALEIGFELRADRISDIVFENNDIIHVERGAALSIHNAEGAVVDSVRYEDIRVEDARHKLIDFAVVYSQYSLDRPRDAADRERLYLQGAWDGVLRVPPGREAEHAQHRGRIQNVVVRDVAVMDGPLPFSVISGFDDEHNVEDVTIEGLTYLGRPLLGPGPARMFIEHADGVTFR